MRDTSFSTRQRVDGRNLGAVNKYKEPFSYVLSFIFKNDYTIIKKILITHGIVKKTQKTSIADIEYALDAMKTYFKRKEDSKDEE